jgi:hypothetical protein
MKKILSYPMMSSVVQLCPQPQAGNDAQLTAEDDPHLTVGLNAHARMTAGQLPPPAAAVDDGEMHAVAAVADAGGGGGGEGKGGG